MKHNYPYSVYRLVLSPETILTPAIVDGKEVWVCKYDCTYTRQEIAQGIHGKWIEPVPYNNFAILHNNKTDTI